MVIIIVFFKKIYFFVIKNWFLLTVYSELVLEKKYLNYYNYTLYNFQNIFFPVFFWVINVVNLFLNIDTHSFNYMVPNKYLSKFSKFSKFSNNSVFIFNRIQKILTFLEYFWVFFYNFRLFFFKKFW